MTACGRLSASSMGIGRTLRFPFPKTAAVYRRCSFLCVALPKARLVPAGHFSQASLLMVCLSDLGYIRCTA